MTNARKHKKRSEKLLARITAFAQDCFRTSDTKALYDFTAAFCDLMENIEAEHEELLY